MGDVEVQLINFTSPKHFDGFEPFAILRGLTLTHHYVAPLLTTWISLKQNQYLLVLTSNLVDKPLGTHPLQPNSYVSISSFKCITQPIFNHNLKSVHPCM